MSGAALPADVALAVDGYLAAVDDAIPGLVETLLLSGSVALGDYQPPISDIDLVALCASPPTAEDCARLAVLHRPSRPSVDVLYATRDDLRRDPTTLSLPGSVDGTFRDEGAFDANPVGWRLLSTRAIAVRGTAPGAADVWFDAAALRRWNLENLDGYWSGWVESARAEEGTEALVRFEYGFQWLVLGVPRLHYTIATTDVTSKSGAGRYALEIVPAELRTALGAALALREDRSTTLPAAPEALWRDAIDLSTWCIADARRLAHRAGS
jgi:hypothetical protein